MIPALWTRSALPPWLFCNPGCICIQMHRACCRAPRASLNSSPVQTPAPTRPCASAQGSGPWAEFGATGPSSRCHLLRGIRSPRRTGPVEKQKEVHCRAQGAISKPHREPPVHSMLTNKKHLTDHSAENRLHLCSCSLSPGSAPARQEPGTEQRCVSGAGTILTALPASIH